VFALDGQIGIHDPSTVIVQDGKFYAYLGGFSGSSGRRGGFDPKTFGGVCAKRRPSTRK
jgi:hypothetical protein